MEANTEPSDAAAYFCSDDEIVEYINAWMADGSPREIARALGDVARSCGMTEVSLRSGPQPLYAALSSDGNPTLEMVAAVLDALELQLSVRKAV